MRELNFLSFVSFCSHFLCLATQCPPLKGIPNGIVEQATSFFGDVANIACDPGYKLQGSEIRECQANMEWSGVDGVCSCEFNIDSVLQSVWHGPHFG